MPKRFVSIWFPHLATDWFELRKPELKKISFVLVLSSHGRMIITSANALARKKGIRKGMVLADARAILPSLQYFDDKPDLKGQLLQRIAEWCIRFTPSAAVDPTEGILLDATGCPHLWGGEQVYITDIISRLKNRGYMARAAIADTIGAAWAVTRFGNTPVIEKGKQLDALLALPCEALRIETGVVERLYKLGLTQIKDLVPLPASALRRRFGPFLIQRLHQALGTEEEWIQPVYPTEPYQQRLPCPEPILHIEGIEIALQQLLQQLCARLQKEGKGLRTAYFRCYRADNKTTGITITTSRASANVAHLFHLFQMKLSTIEPGPGIELFLLEASKVEDHCHGQEALWKETGFGNQVITELIDRLASKIGAGAIHHYLPEEHHWPERSFKKLNSFSEQAAAEWKVDRPRPLQLLTPPEQIEVTAPVPDYPPMLFRYRGKLHKIIKADGPERIEQEWWIQQGAHRDYYAVEDEEGCRYWLFRSGHYNEETKPLWYLHGYFA